ncbi:MAG: hypothetical protein HN560_11060 [Anaerolineae bacterium]|jgi:hypothetical protein|nr:hypothetical protein [Anaerolineae bacterium]MBT7988804.1 hypothetical protein [Anaerolineae bacterium]
MNRDSSAAIFVFGIIILGLFLLASSVVAAPGAQMEPTPMQQSTPEPHVATKAELDAAHNEWSNSQHADTYDFGLGANTTCASCKSPRNWDPANPALDEAHDCAACKRIPGAPRPVLVSGEAVAQSEWKNIGCDICHQPMGDSFWTGISFWDQAAQSYEPVESVGELCGKCHEGQHGFEVVEEQQNSPAHNQWNCTDCHGVHGAPSTCTDCHDPLEASGADEHERHPSVNCTGCHDQGGLSIWLEDELTSKHNGEYIPRKFAHTLTSWPSHNLSKQVDCLRCHHPPGGEQPIVAQTVSCVDCHPNGEVFFWCTYFERNPDPNPTPTPTPTLTPILTSMVP